MRISHLPCYLLATTLSLLAIGQAAAQTGRPPIVIGQFGFSVGDSKGGVGTVCSGFSCTPLQWTTSVNEKLGIGIRAPRNSRYFVIVGPKTNMCVTVPGILNQWVVPAVVLIPGVVNQPDAPFSIRCFGWHDALSILVPASASGVTVSVQAVAEVVTGTNVIQPAFSIPIDISVR
jgi:hypothetical protein